MKWFRNFLVFLTLAAVSGTGLAACSDMNSGGGSSAGNSGSSSSSGGY
jgi:hypothetical protein